MIILLWTGLGVIIGISLIGTALCVARWLWQHQEGFIQWMDGPTHKALDEYKEREL